MKTLRSASCQKNFHSSGNMDVVLGQLKFSRSQLPALRFQASVEILLPSAVVISASVIAWRCICIWLGIRRLVPLYPISMKRSKRKLEFKNWTIYLDGHKQSSLNKEHMYMYLFGSSNLGTKNSDISKYWREHQDIKIPNCDDVA